jgi:hypothetical protein
MKLRREEEFESDMSGPILPPDSMAQKGGSGEAKNWGLQSTIERREGLL